MATITGKARPFMGGMVKIFDGHVVMPVGDELIPLGEKETSHILAVQSALEQRGLADYNVQPLLGERGRADIDAQSARDVLQEVENTGWFINHYVLGQEDLTLYYRGPDKAGTRMMLLVAPHLPKNGELSYRVEKAEKGVHTLVTGSNNHRLLLLSPGAELIINRHRCRSGWSEMSVRWNGSRMSVESDVKPGRQQGRKRDENAA
jgi:hypothetical protein